MEMQHLYDRMKDCLTFFSLSFHEMKQVHVIVTDDGNLRFEHSGTAIEIEIPHE